MESEGSLPHSQLPATCPSPVPARSTPCPPSHFLKINLNIIRPSTPGSPKWSLSLSFPHQTPVYASPLLHTRYMPRPSHSSWFYHPKNIGWGERSLSSSLRSFLHSPVTSSLLGPNILLNALFSNTLSLRSSVNVSDQVSHKYKKKKGKIIVLYTLLLCIFLDSQLEDKRFCFEWQQAFPGLHVFDTGHNLKTALLEGIMSDV